MEFRLKGKYWWFEMIVVSFFDAQNVEEYCEMVFVLNTIESMVSRIFGFDSRIFGFLMASVAMEPGGRVFWFVKCATPFNTFFLD